jgi:spore maturation protein SpmB
MIMGAVGIVVLTLVFAAVYPLIGGATGVVATVLTNTSSTGYVGALLSPLAAFIPTLYVLGVIIGIVFLGLSLFRTSESDEKIF